MLCYIENGELYIIDMYYVKYQIRPTGELDTPVVIKVLEKFNSEEEAFSEAIANADRENIYTIRS